MKSTSHKITIVTALMHGGEMTATDFGFISNPNQYFCDLEKSGILKSREGTRGSARVKLRSIDDHSKAQDFLNRHKSIPRVEGEN